MLRTLLAGAVAAGLILAATSPAQDKKEPPKKEQPKKERIAVADPKEAAKDADFAVQGEYTGEIKLNSGDKKIGAQVVAKGLGEFDIKITIGGLPGDGWDGKTTMKATAKRGPDGTVAIAGPNTTGSIGDGKLAIKDGMKIDATLAKITRKIDSLGKEPPQGAVVLFGKEGDEANWNNGRLLELSDGKFLTVAKVKDAGGKEKGGSIVTKEKLGSFKAHIEFRTPWMPNSGGQQRGNSGVYLQDRYELQVLDSFGLNGENNECGGLYTQHKPTVNMCLPPLSWQTYDIEFTAAEFADGKKTKNARATIHHNGVKIHDNVEFPKEGPGGKPETADPGPFQFQDHGDPVVYKNVWVVRVK